VNKYCNIEIKFSNVQEDKVYQLGEIVYGTIRIEPKLDFEIVELGYELQGLFNSDRIFSGKSSILEKCILLENCTLKKGEAISFDFAIKNDSLEDYEGRDFEFSSQFLVFIKMKKGSKLNSKNWIKTAVPIKFSGEGLGHEVVSSTVRLEMEEPMLVLGAIFFFLLFIWGQPGHPIILYPIAFVVFVALTLIGDQIYRTFFIGGIQAQFRTIDDENFEVKFFNNIKFTKANCLLAKWGQMVETILILFIPQKKSTLSKQLTQHPFLSLFPKRFPEHLVFIHLAFTIWLFVK